MIQDLVWLGTALTAATCTYWIHNRFNVNPVLASSLVTLVIAIAITPFEGSSKMLHAIPYIAIGGSFVGMSTKKNAKGLESILLASLIFGLIFIHSSQFFEGFGGALGTSACISVLTAITWRKLAKRTRIKVRRVLSRVGK